MAAALLVTGGAGCGGSSAGTVPTSPPVSEAPGNTGTVPNVIVVMTDDQRTDDVDVMRTVKTELAAKGVTFADNFATYPLCCPSRTTFFTGEYAHNHRVQSNNPPAGGYPGFMAKVDPGRTLGVELQRAGYRTGYVGKFLNEFAPDPENPVPPGWDVFDGLIGVTEYMMFGYSIDQDGTTKKYGSAPADYQTDVLARHAARFVRSSAGTRPFFLTFAPVAPHDDARATAGRATRSPPLATLRRSCSGRCRARPRSTPRSPASRGTCASRPCSHRRLGRSRGSTGTGSASLLAVDDAVARLVRALRSTHELNDTYILFTSDNGYLLGEHRDTAKELPYEPSVKVPLIIRGPGVEQGATRTELAGNIDLAPTILDMAGLPWRERDGRDLAATGAHVGRSGEHPPDPLRARAVGGHPVCRRAHGPLRPDRLRRAARATGRRELFDLQVDPGELHNVYGSPAYAQTRQALEGLLARLRELPRRRLPRPGARRFRSRSASLALGEDGRRAVPGRQRDVAAHDSLGLVARRAQHRVAKDGPQRDLHLEERERGAEAAAGPAAEGDPRVGLRGARRGTAPAGTRRARGRSPRGCGRARCSRTPLVPPAARSRRARRAPSEAGR